MTTRKKTSQSPDESPGSGPAAKSHPARKENSLRAAFDAFVAEYESFLRGREFSDHPETLISACGKLATSIVESSIAIPDELRLCCTELAAFSASWLSVLKTDDQQPGLAFWTNAKTLVEAAEKRPMQLEPVSQLLVDLQGYDQKHEQIARMYGNYNDDLDRYQGFFFNNRGTVDVHLIEQEGRHPGSVVPAGWHPQAKLIADRFDAALERIERLAPEYRTFNRQQSGQPVGDSATIEEMLRDGAFPDQIAMVKGCTKTYVRIIAAKIKFTIRERDEILSQAGRELWTAANLDDKPFIDAMNEVNG